jgi:anti-anti-sigma factor
VAGEVDHLQIAVRQERDRVVLGLSGELDLASAPLLQSEIERAEKADTSVVVLDLQELRFVDSTGLRIILSAHERSEERGHEFAVTRGSQQVQRILALTGLGEHLRVIGSPDEMLV